MAKYYAVKNGRSAGVYTNWSDCKSQVDGYSGNQYKSFSTPEAAQAYMSGSSSSSGGGGGGGASRSYNTASSGYSSFPYGSGGRYSSSASSGAYTGSSGSSSSSSSSSYTPIYSSPAPSRSVTKHTIYTDGASRNNQGSNARAGYGVYYGPNDPRNVSERLSGERQTNNRAELTAIKHAVDNIHDEITKGKSTTKYSVATDSMYAKNSLEVWSHDWERNGWKTSKGEPVENRDLIEPTLSKIKDINQHYRNNGVGSMEIEKVKAHSTNVGNNMADSLATRGADKDL